MTDPSIATTTGRELARELGPRQAASPSPRPEPPDRGAAGLVRRAELDELGRATGGRAERRRLATTTWRTEAEGEPARRRAARDRPEAAPPPPPSPARRAASRPRRAATAGEAGDAAETDEGRGRGVERAEAGYSDEDESDAERARRCGVVRGRGRRRGVLRDLIANWNVPSWDEIIAGLYRPER